MKIVTWNVNGLRSVYKKGFLEWLSKEDADVVCLQEIKVGEDVIPAGLKNIDRYHAFFNCAAKPGYAGVAVYTKKKPKNVSRPSFSDRFDQEGRILELEFDDFNLINLYLPHGGRQKENLEYKLDCYRHLQRYLSEEQNRNVVLAGDFNIAHGEIDLARPKQNKDNIMFTPEERAQLDELISIGFIDSFRHFRPDGAGYYTWWPYMADARTRNLGWRIDYIFVSKTLSVSVSGASILSDVLGSDHCPLGIDLEMSHKH
ncbi:MAG: exodeoxyribonuclease III [Patescibacteria group bacterium]